MGLDQPWHWLVVIALAAVLFGYKRLPDASRSLGRSLRIFKTEIKGLGDDDKSRQEAATPVVAAAPVVTPAEPASVVTTAGTPPATSAQATPAPAEAPAPPAE